MFVLGGWGEESCACVCETMWSWFPRCRTGRGYVILFSVAELWPELIFDLRGGSANDDSALATSVTVHRSGVKTSEGLCSVIRMNRSDLKQAECFSPVIGSDLI